MTVYLENNTSEVSTRTTKCAKNHLVDPICTTQTAHNDQKFNYLKTTDVLKTERPRTDRDIWRGGHNRGIKNATPSDQQVNPIWFRKNHRAIIQTPRTIARVRNGLDQKYEWGDRRLETCLAPRDDLPRRRTSEGPRKLWPKQGSIPSLSMRHAMEHKAHCWLAKDAMRKRIPPILL